MMMKRALKISGIVLVFLWLFASLLPAQEKGYPKGEYPLIFTPAKISLRIHFPEPEIIKIGSYHRIRMYGLTNFEGFSGDPSLPVRTVKLLVPYEKEAKEIKVVGENKVTFSLSYMVEPTPRPVPIIYQGPSTLPDPEVYNSSAPFPKNLSSDRTTQIYKGYPILSLNIHPVEYIPSQGQISYYKSILIEVDLEASVAPLFPTPMYRGLPPHARKIKQMVDNPDAMKTYFYDKEGGEIILFK